MGHTETLTENVKKRLAGGGTCTIKTVRLFGETGRQGEMSRDI